MPFNFASRSVQWTVLLLLALTWGSSFILMKKGLHYFDSTQVAAFRMSMAMLVLLPISLRNLRTLRGNFWPLLISGLCGNAIPAFLFALAQTQISSATSGMLNALTSLFTLIIGVLFFSVRTSGLQVAGVLIALTGAAALIGFRNFYALGIYGQYALLIVAATILYGIGVNVIKAKLQHVRPTHITSLAFLLTAPWLMIYLLGFTDFTHRLAANPGSWIGVFYLSILAIVGTSLAVIIFNRLIKEVSTVFATSVTYLIPVVAMGWGLLDGESITLSQVLCMLLILAGIFLINMSQSEMLNKFPRLYTSASSNSQSGN